MFFNYFLSKIVLKNPLSIKLAKIFLNIIKTIGPTKSPIIPINLNPVYIAIKVNIGCIPMFLLTHFGSKNCLTTDIIINNVIIAIPNLKSPFSPEIIAHGTITVPEPKIGSASTNPINKAIRRGYCTLNFKNDNKYNPISEIIKEINIKVVCAFKYPPNVCISSFKCRFIFLNHTFGK